jgi:hypothetical protein
MTKIFLLSAALMPLAAPCLRAQAEAPATTATPAASLFPPQTPVREKAALESASDLALDMSKLVIFLEAGQSYYRAYGKGTHSEAENKAFVKFLEDYQRVLGELKQEEAALRVWIDKKSEL